MSDKLWERMILFSGSMPLALLLVIGVNLQQSGYRQKDLFIEVLGYLTVTAAIALLRRTSAERETKV